MTTFTVELPPQCSTGEKEAKMILAAGLYERGELTSGQAAALVGITKREFIETVGQYGVSVFGQTTIEEILQDAENAAAATDPEVLKRSLAGVR